MDDHRADGTGQVLDDDPPGAVRTAFAWLTGCAGIMLLLPRQWVSAAICFAFSALTLVLHLVLRRRERRVSAPASPPESPSPEPPEASA